MIKNFVVSTFSTVLLLSLMCSLSLQQSHAEMRIADSAEETHPLKSGDQAPSFTVRDVNNAEFVFEPGELSKPVVIITFRGGWCPYCNMHLSELRTVVPEIAAMGIDVIFLSGDRPELLYASLKQDTQDDIADLDYKIYSDADAEAAVALGIAFKTNERMINWLEEKNHDYADSSIGRHRVLAVPAVYAIDKSGVIQFDFVEANYKVRLPAEDLLVVAKEIAD